LPVRHTGFEDALERLRVSLKELRAHCRERGWTSATSDSSLDRFTLLGAFTLARSSLRVIGARRKSAKIARPMPTEAERRLRVEADMLSLTAVAENPEPVPGTPWALIAVAVATALVSLIAMGWLWNFYVAAVVLAAVAFHEAGHAAAMRRFGYRDVHIFFVPLLGALTTGRPATASVRDRLVVLLAGPVPGLWLGLILAVLEKTSFPIPLLRVAAPVLLVLNGLNLLPFTPLDGGRAMEVLTRPESIWRVVIHVVSALALIALGIHFHDKLLAGIGGAWLSQIPRQWQAYQLRRAVAATAPDKTDFRAVARLTLEIITANPRYASWRATTRQATARAFGRSFADAPATSADRVWGAIAYASAWIPVGAWFLIRAS
jgi:Zn-dependent protease